MSEKQGNQLCNEELAFFGKIGADISHEMRNVLSIIGEYAGLQDDLLAAAKRRKPPDCTKLRALCANIAKQVKKGTATMERLSRFSHAADEPIASFDLTVLTGNMVDLAKRHAAMAGCKLEAALPDQAVWVKASPFSMQYAIFSVIQLLLDALEKGGLITVSLVTQGSAAVISASSEAAAGELSIQTSGLSFVMAEMDGTVEAASANGSVSVILTLPIKTNG